MRIWSALPFPCQPPYQLQTCFCRKAGRKCLFLFLFPMQRIMSQPYITVRLPSLNNHLLYNILSMYYCYNTSFFSRDYGEWWRCSLLVKDKIFTLPINSAYLDSSPPRQRYTLQFLTNIFKILKNLWFLWRYK